LSGSLRRLPSLRSEAPSDPPNGRGAGMSARKHLLDAMTGAGVIGGPGWAKGLVDAAIREAVEADRTREALSATLAALGAYGSHHNWCMDPVGYPATRCHCGYNTALDVARKALVG
jgi:hypothetical protein